MGRDRGASSKKPACPVGRPPDFLPQLITRGSSPQQYPSVWRRSQPPLRSQAQYSHLQTSYQSHQSCWQGGWAVAGVELLDHSATVIAAIANNRIIDLVVLRFIATSLIAHPPSFPHVP